MPHAVYPPGAMNQGKRIPKICHGVLVGGQRYERQVYGTNGPGSSGQCLGHACNFGQRTKAEKPEVKVERIKQDTVDGSTEAETNAEEPVMPPPTETTKSLEFKLTLLEMYNQRVRKRHEAKALMFDRGLLEYKKVRLVG